jgi:hypothetical protein
LKKKILNLKDGSSSSDEDNDRNNDSRRVLFMVLEIQVETTENNEGDYEEEGDVNLEAQLISVTHQNCTPRYLTLSVASVSVAK